MTRIKAYSTLGLPKSESTKVILGLGQERFLCFVCLNIRNRHDWILWIFTTNYATNLRFDFDNQKLQPMPTCAYRRILYTQMLMKFYASKSTECFSVPFSVSHCIRLPFGHSLRSTSKPTDRLWAGREAKTNHNNMDPDFGIQ